MEQEKTKISHLRTTTSTSTTQKSYRIPILLLVTLPAFSFGMFTIIMSQALSIMYDEPNAAFAPTLKAITDILSLITIPWMLATPLCFIVGIVLLSKHIVSPSSTATPSKQHSDTAPSDASRVENTIIATLSLIFLWLIVPLGFYIAYIGSQIANAMNGSGCEQDPSADHCQPSYLWLYFIMYAIVGFIMAKSIVFKKVR